MSLVEVTITQFQLIDAIEIGKHKYAAFIGSRTLKDDEDLMDFIRNFSRKLCHEHSCKVVSGAAYGPDQAGMEGALDIPLHSLDPIIPLSSRNSHLISALLEKLTGSTPFVDDIECFFSTDRLIVFYPDFKDGYHAGKYFERDEKIARVADVVIAFWDGKSRGTKETVDYATSQGKKLFLITS